MEPARLDRMKRTTFASLSYAAKKKRTKRERFLAEMEAVVPWAELEAVIEPCYPKAGKRGGQPRPLVEQGAISCSNCRDIVPDRTYTYT